MKRCLASTAYPAAKLVQLSQTESLGMRDQHHGSVRHGDADFDDGCRHENMRLPSGKGLHYSVFFIAFKAAVQKRHTLSRENRRQFLKTFRRRTQIQLLGLLDHRINNVALPAASNFFCDPS